MRKIFRTAMLLLVPSILCGCSSFLSWEGWSAASTKVVVVNNTQDIQLDISVNGRSYTKGNLVQPGEDFSILLPNFHEGTDREYLVLVKGRDCSNEVIGVTERVYNVQSYKQGCRPLIVDSDTFRKRK